MAKKTDKPTDAAAEAKAARNAKYSASEQEEYTLAVIRKQCGVKDEEAAKRLKSLSAEEAVALHDAGREGRVADCRELLGLE